MGKRKKDDEYSEEEAQERFEKTVRGALKITLRPHEKKAEIKTEKKPEKRRILKARIFGALPLYRLLRQLELGDDQSD
jgi:hypothetical protein